MKRSIIFFILILLMISTSGLVQAQEPPDLPEQTVYSPTEAMALLYEGNMRFVKNTSVYPNQTMHQRKLTTLQGEKPFATIITGSDSRIIPAVIFDRGIGDLFVIRNLGNVAGTDTLASVEYSMNILETPLLIVMGSTHNEIIKSAIEKKSIQGHMAQLTGKLIPAIEMTRTLYPKAKGQELIRKVAETNVRQVLRDILGQCPQVLKKFRAGEIQVIGALYDVDTGEVNWLGP